jgi:hypothetical protein
MRNHLFGTQVLRNAREKDILGGHLQKNLLVVSQILYASLDISDPGA